MRQSVSSSRNSVVLLICLTLCIASKSLFAGCSLANGTHNNAVLNLDLGDVSVPPGTPNGAKLKDLMVDGGGWFFQCDRDTNFTFTIVSTKFAVADHVFDSGFKGIGFRLKLNNTVANGSDDFSIYANSPNSGLYTHYYVTLVKTGEVTPGQFSKEIWGRSELSGGFGIMDQIQITGGRIIVPTCDAIADKLIELGRVSAKAIDSNTSAGDKVIDIPMNCGTGFKIFAKLSGTAPAGSSATGLIQNSGTASGVSVQLIDGNKNPIRLGDKIEQPNNGANTIYKIGARAYKTGTVGAGTINAQATLTMTYE